MLEDTRLVELHYRLLFSGPNPEAIYAEMRELLSSDRTPLPIPEGMQNEELLNLMVTEGRWRILEGFVCITCGAPALLHPYTNQIWGCLCCRRTTLSTSIFFRSKGSHVTA